MVAQVAQCKPQKKKGVPELSMSQFLCPKVFFLLFFWSVFFAFFLDHGKETFFCLSWVFPFSFFVIFLFFFWTNAVKMKQELYLGLYPVAHFHEVKFIELQNLQHTTGDGVVTCDSVVWRCWVAGLQADNSTKALQCCQCVDCLVPSQHLHVGCSHLG